MSVPTPADRHAAGGPAADAAPGTVLVLGATGYIGSAVAHRLHARGHRILAVVRDGSAVETLPSGTLVRYGDLTRPESLAAAVSEEVSAVVHAAAPTGDPEVESAAVAALVDALAGSDRPLVYLSGIWVLGATGDTPAHEQSPVDPVDLVSFRPAVEQQVLDAGTAGVRGIVVRPGVVHGRGGGIPALLTRLAAEQGAGVYVGSDAGPRWPMVHVDDLAALVEAALDRAPAGSLLHGVGEPGVPARELALAAADAVGLTGKVRPWAVEDAAAALGAGFAEALGLDQVVVADRTRELLGWTPAGPAAVEEVAGASYRP